MIIVMRAGQTDMIELKGHSIANGGWSWVRGWGLNEQIPELHKTLKSVNISLLNHFEVLSGVGPKNGMHQLTLAKPPPGKYNGEVDMGENNLQTLAKHLSGTNTRRSSPIL